MKKRAFIIEDDKDLAEIFKQAISAKLDVEVISDGRTAKKRLDEEAPFLILLDMHLPHISGAELLARIKADDRFASTIIIITTADANMGEWHRDQVDFVMLKPISFVQLRDLVARLIRD